jgi:hypothetical protein
MVMQKANLSTLAHLRQSIEELVPLIETAQSEVSGESGKKAQNGLELLMSDLTMIALLLTNVDLKVSADELDLINDLRRAIYGAGVPLLNSFDYDELCREFLRLYPKKRLTIDQLPNSIKYLLAYDQVHGTEYAEKARALFFQFAEAIVSADQNKDSVESIMLLNFKDILYPTSSTE